TSPGNVSFYIGNPTENEVFPYIELRQEGDFSDYWNASIRVYSSCPLASNENVTLDFIVDVNETVAPGESRIFIVDLYINGELWEGIRINVTKMETETQSMLDIIWGIITSPFFLTGVVIVIIVVGVCCLKQKQS
ncbi:MAG: hypothetical protein ACFFAY_11525, partial [Promethearchaeota archaeon]